LLIWLKNKISELTGRVNKLFSPGHPEMPDSSDEPDEVQEEHVEQQNENDESMSDEPVEEVSATSAVCEDDVDDPELAPTSYYERITQASDIRLASVQSSTAEQSGLNLDVSQSSPRDSKSMYVSNVSDYSKAIRVSSFPKIQVTSPDKLFTLHDITQPGGTVVQPKQVNFSTDDPHHIDLDDAPPSEENLELNDDLFSWVARKINHSIRTSINELKSNEKETDESALSERSEKEASTQNSTAASNESSSPNSDSDSNGESNQ
jgi:hypothetical protein